MSRFGDSDVSPVSVALGVRVRSGAGSVNMRKAGDGNSRSAGAGERGRSREIVRSLVPYVLKCASVVRAKEQDSSLSAERFYKILIYTAYFGSWGLLPTNSTVII